MPRETLGYVRLEWTCPKCGSRNPGPQKTCGGCGAAQPEDVHFEQMEHQELIKDEAEILQAKAGPDIHCAFCGTRNPAGSSTCSQCGADLKEGKPREVGHVVGAFQAGEVKQVACPHCGMMNPESALKCAHCGASTALEPQPTPSLVTASAPPVKTKTNWLWIVGIGLLLALCLFAMLSFAVRSSRTEGRRGVVAGVKWVTSVIIEELRPVRYQGWRDAIPAEAEIGDCTPRVHHIQDEPAPNSNKVCGTPYTVDKGSGYAEVVQDCQYEVLVDYCDFVVMEWTQVSISRLEGGDFSPLWPNPQISSHQRLGKRNQTYTIIFETAEGRYTYTTDRFDEFQMFEINSEWILNVNAFGQVVSFEPAG